ncbi:MAG: FAD-binding oxidoreductase, partial [Alphaproteobacteria bacterium]|nr:FAD-binding oxidoreductase [Alphaproteobacteria bacterium]
WRVTLFDPLGAGESCSAGNAGIIVSGAVPPLANPGIFRELPRLLVDRSSPLSIHWAYLPQIMPWLVRFALASTERRVEAGTAALTQLIGKIDESFAPLIASAGAADLISRRGQLFVYQSRAALQRARPSLERRRRHGAKLEEVGPQEICRIEPALATNLAGGWYRNDGAHVVDPQRFTKMLAADFRRGGGDLREQKVEHLEFHGDTLYGVTTGRGTVTANAVIIASGAWSRRFCRELGLRAPLDTERGYAVTLPKPGFALGLPVSSGEGGFFMTPMADGLRIAGTVEFAGLRRRPRPGRIAAMLRRARMLLPGLNDSNGAGWMGFRSSLPDSLPVISEVPGRRGVYLAFGHGHLGLSLAAVTGSLISNLVSGRAPSMDLAPFRVQRF